MQKLLRLSERIGKYLIAAVAIIVPLFPKFPLLSISGTYVAIRFEDLLLLVLAVFTLFAVLPKLKSFFSDKLSVSFLIFFAAAFVSLISGAFLTRTISFNLGLLHWLRRIEYVVPLFACLYLLKKEKTIGNLSFFIKVLMMVVFVAFVYGLGQRYLHFPVIITQNEEYSKGTALFWIPGSHINSTFAGHYDLAAFLVLVLPILIAMIAVLKANLVRLMSFICAASGFWLLVNSLSRTGQISYLFAVSVSLALAKKFRVLGIILIVSIVLMGMSSGVQERFQRVIEVIYKQISVKNLMSLSRCRFEVSAKDVTLPAKRMETPISTPTPIPVFEDRSASIRLNVEWPRAIRAFVKNPALGTGYSSINLATDNDFLRALGETGIIGLLSLLLIFVEIGRVFLRTFPLNSSFSLLEKAYIVGVIGGVLGTFVSAFFIDLFEASKFATMFWLVVGLAVYLIRNRNYVQKY